MCSWTGVFADWRLTWRPTFMCCIQYRIFFHFSFWSKTDYCSLSRRKLGHATLQVTFIYTCINFVKQGNSFASKINESTVLRLFFFVIVIELPKYCDIRYIKINNAWESFLYSNFVYYFGVLFGNVKRSGNSCLNLARFHTIVYEM